MRVKKLEMKNFRGFEELTIEFPEKGSAVFVGVNGAGKTSVLECIRTLLNSSVSGDKLNYDIPFGFRDVRNGADDLIGTINGKVDGKDFSIKNELLTSKRGWKTKRDINITFLEFISEKIKKKPNSNIPFFVFYATDRFVDGDPDLNTKDYSIENQMDAFSFSYNIDFKDFFKWFRNVEDLENEIRLEDNTNFRNRKLETIRIALESFLPHFSNFRIKRRGLLEFVAKKNGEWVSLVNLSHGEKSMIAMIGDIARRLSIANPSLENPLEGKGIILIDEIELHLHPKWQRTIVPRLEKTFPNIQFVLTTHSPQVLSNMKRENVFILEDFKLVKNTPHTFGKDSNSILYDLFGVSERPEHAKKEFKKLYRLIDDVSKVEEAKEEYQKMKEKYGEFDPEILRVGVHLNFLTE